MAKSKGSQQQQSDAIPASAVTTATRRQQHQSVEKPEKVEKIKGSIKWYNAEKKYGFVIYEEDAKDEEGNYFTLQQQVLVLKDCILADRSGEVVPQDGEKVEFVMGPGLDGKPIAVDVKVLRKPIRKLQQQQQQFGDGYSNNNGGSGDGQCYNCGGVGHMARNCEEACNKCKIPGHKPKDCPGPACYTCGQSGHRARECSQNSVAAE